MPQRPLARAVLIFCIGLLVLLIGIAGYLYATGALDGDQNVSGMAKPDIGGPFELVDQTGETRRAEDFRGRYMLVYFGYTYCPDICPTSLLEMTRALDLLEAQAPEKEAKVTPVFVTVDPERDTVEALADYAGHFHENLVALTGSDEEVARAAKAYRVYYSKAEVEGDDDDAYLMDHSSFIYLMGPDGEYVTHYSHMAGAEEMAADMAKRVEG
ncbi:MAG: SCO family protein [Rhodovibrionaceae bacterium]|nr:SCO family protein [Rhodovibrionaceae bacterium]